MVMAFSPENAWDALNGAVSKPYGFSICYPGRWNFT
jgi:hypothetical protein